jgi:hypothetical protein
LWLGVKEYGWGSWPWSFSSTSRRRGSAADVVVVVVVFVVVVVVLTGGFFFTLFARGRRFGGQRWCLCGWQRLTTGGGREARLVAAIAPSAAAIASTTAAIASRVAHRSGSLM